MGPWIMKKREQIRSLLRRTHQRQEIPLFVEHVPQSGDPMTAASTSEADTPNNSNVTESTPSSDADTVLLRDTNNLESDL